MPPRKRVKTGTEHQVSQDFMNGISSESALHPDLAHQASSLKMDPSLLHPDLQGTTNTLQSAILDQHSSDFTVNQSNPTPSPAKQQKPSVTARLFARAMAAQIEQTLQQLTDQEQHPDSQPTAIQEQEESTVSVDAAAEFLRTIEHFNLMQLNSGLMNLDNEDG